METAISNLNKVQQDRDIFIAAILRSKNLSNEKWDKLEYVLSQYPYSKLKSLYDKLDIS